MTPSAPASSTRPIGAASACRQAHRGGDRDVLEPAQHQRDVGVAEIAVLDVESDVVVTGGANSSGPMTVGPTTQPPHTCAWRWRVRPAACSLHPSCQATIAILIRPGTGRRREFERGLHVVDAERVGQVAVQQAGMGLRERVGRRQHPPRSSVTPDFSVRLLRSMVRMLIG